MKRKILFLLLGAVMIATISVCILAKTRDGDPIAEDRPVGILLTMQMLDRSDGGRIDAQTVSVTSINEETGESGKLEDRVFEGVGGIRFFTIETEDDSGSYTHVITDEGVSGGQISVNTGDNETRTVMSGTVYIPEQEDMVLFYFNPVYQTPDGSVYAVQGDGLNISEGVAVDGFAQSMTFDYEAAPAKNGESMTNGISITMTVAVIPAPEKTVLLQMDGADNVLSRTEYAPGTLPEVLKTDAEYIVVETHQKSANADTKITREIYGKDAESIETLYLREDGICLKKQTAIDWDGE